ncbi:hypothetical protein EVAR_64352_1 [Eumeta japonica]|uniref:Uncharacterized protein n=1 Tax=Eumeta variegata TaxID=151549 RepID=A0A4C1ZNM6_EUMVA|nr:hypothetical protein EVAR_64352_1 [Eumeta japonica]
MFFYEITVWETSKIVEFNKRIQRPRGSSTDKRCVLSLRERCLFGSHLDARTRATASGGARRERGGVRDYDKGVRLRSYYKKLILIRRIVPKSPPMNIINSSISGGEDAGSRGDIDRPLRTGPAPRRPPSECTTHRRPVLLMAVNPPERSCRHR